MSHTLSIDQVLQWIREGEGESVEFKQSPSNDLGKSVSAFSNTNGGAILIGVGDDGHLVGSKGKKVLQEISDFMASVVPAPKISTKTFSIGDKAIVVVLVEKGAHLYACRNVVYIRVGRNNRPLSIQEVIEKGNESLRIFFDEMTVKARVTDIDKNLVKRFLKVREEVRGVTISSVSEERQMELVRILKGKKEVMQGGLLFFGKTPQSWMPQARVHCIHFLDNDMQRYSDQRFFEGSLWRIIEEIETYLRSHVRRVGGDKKGFRRQEVFEYPLEAVREALLNALIHRNYFSAADVKLFFFPDRLVIKNPGSFPHGVTPDMPEHRPRNPLLAQYFYDVGLVEKYGSGLETMKRVCERSDSVTLEFDLREASTTVIFRKKDSLIHPVDPDELDASDKKILKRLEEGPGKSSDFIKVVGVSRQALAKRLKKLLVAGLIRREGNGASVTYCLAVQGKVTESFFDPLSEEDLKLWNH